MALQEKKFLLITNGPRTGKFYPESLDNKNPTIRQFDKENWISFDKLSEDQRKNINKNLVHSPNSPLDPISTAFLQGIHESGLDKKHYQFFDFKSEQPVKSAYKAMAAALFKNKESSIACYSGDSISYAELAYFIPKTYAFTVDSMNAGHKKALERFSQKLHMIRHLDFQKSIQEQPIDMSQKESLIKKGSKQDATLIVNAIEKLTLKTTETILYPGKWQNMVQ